MGPRGPLRILVVDDEDRIRKLVVRTLRRVLPDVEYHEAGDGFEAGRKISELVPTLVISGPSHPGPGRSQSVRIRSSRRPAQRHRHFGHFRI
jgi:CheY-like chemotaxis protein